MIGEGLVEKKIALTHMEADCEALARFVTPGEVGHIRAQLIHTTRCHDELKGRIEFTASHTIIRRL